jgi:hypothetical protein
MPAQYKQKDSQSIYKINMFISVYLQKIYRYLIIVELNRARFEQTFRFV